MKRGITLPLIGGGVLAFLWGGVGAATIMWFGDASRELPAWREGFANVLLGLIFAYFPVYCTVLIASVVLKWKNKDVTAYRVSLIPFSVPLVFAVLLAAYLLIPGQK